MLDLTFQEKKVLLDLLESEISFLSENVFLNCPTFLKVKLYNSIFVKISILLASDYVKKSI